MPYKDFSVGEILTSSDVDTYLMSQVIIRCTSSTRPSSPAQGWHIYETDTNKTLRYNGSSWEELSASPPIAILTKTADQAIPNATTTDITFNAEEVDTHGGHSTSSNTNRYTSQKAGYYQLSAQIAFDANSTGYRTAYIQKNNTGTVLGTCSGPANTGGGITSFCISALVYLALGDYAHIEVSQTSGGSLNVHGVAGTPARFYVQWVSP